MRSALIGFGLLTSIATAAEANDSTAELGAGGLQLVRNDTVELVSEDLYLSVEEVRVNYRFRNRTDTPVTYLVAFPLPVIDAIVPEAVNVVLPDSASENFVGFTVTVDGVPVTPSVEARATALGVDRTEVLRRFGLPLNPIADGLYQVLENAPFIEKDELNQIGLVYIDPYSVQAAWRLETIFYWEQTFPPGRDVVVEHRYRPVAGYGFFGDWVFNEPSYRERYCIDDAFEMAARKKLAAVAGTSLPYLQERRVRYILTTGNNWAGPIGDFRLVVDKGRPDALVSFCGTGVRKISPTAFEMRATDFVPEREIDILIATPAEN